MATKSHRVQFKLANCSDAKVMARLRKMLCSSNLGWIGKCSRCEVPEQEKMRNSSLIRAIWPNHNGGCQPSHWLWSYVSLFAWPLHRLHCFCRFFRQDFLSFCWVGWMALPPLLVPPPVLEATNRLLLRMSLSSSSVPLQCPMSNLLKRHNFFMIGSIVAV